MRTRLAREAGSVAVMEERGRGRGKSPRMFCWARNQPGRQRLGPLHKIIRWALKNTGGISSFWAMPKAMAWMALGSNPPLDIYQGLPSRKECNPNI
jgi:hypothetical protein